MARTTAPPPPDPAVPGPSTRPLTRAERRHGAALIGDPPRRTMAAGHIVVVGIVCLLVGALLNAPGIRKTALGQPVGWKRDVARFFADPLYDVSHAIGADRLRIGLQDLLGRKGDDRVDLTLPSPTTTTPGTATTVPKKRAFDPAHHLRLWVGGDSLAITPGESLINAVSANGVTDVIGPVDGHVSTGLARPEVFNWPAHLIDVRNASAPDAYVLTMGSNDDQDLTGEGGGETFGSDAWQAEYHRRVGGLMDSVTGDRKHKLFLIGTPIIKNTERAETRYKVINAIYKAEAELRPGLVYYIDIYDMFKGPDGGYADYLANSDGSLVQMRASDGIHFTRAGGDRIANKVLDTMATTYDLTSWQSTTTTAPPTTKPKKSGKGGK